MIELLIGIILYGILGETAILAMHAADVPLERFFGDGIVEISVGFLIGIVFSCGIIIHMARSVEAALSMGEHDALKHTRISYIIRMVCLLVVFALMLVLGFGNVFAMLFGLLSLKLSAYAQPITHKVKEKLKKGR